MMELATKDWAAKEMIDTEKRIEKAFHDQTQYLGAKQDALTQRYDVLKDDLKSEIAIQTRWMFGLVITMTLAILVAVLFGS